MKTSKTILRITILFLTIAIIMSLKLWMNYRIFPLIPVIDIPIISPLIGYIALGILFILLITSFIFLNRSLIIGLLTLLILLGIQDQMRWQPWFYHYLLFLLPFSFKNKTVNIGYFQLIIIGIYFWAGVSKINKNFIDEIFPDLIFGLKNWNLSAYKEIGYIIPLTEIFISIGLLFRKTQKWAFFGGIFTHAFILINLSPLGSYSNNIIIPWNFAMISFLFLCFQNVTYESPFSNVWKNENRKINLFIISMFLILPIMNFWGKWDNYLSFSIYSGKGVAFSVAIEESQIHKLGFDVTEILTQIKKREKREIIDINILSKHELNVPTPPQKRIFKGIAKSFCKLNIPIMFLESERPITNSNTKVYNCETLN